MKNIFYSIGSACVCLLLSARSRGGSVLRRHEERLRRRGLVRRRKGEVLRKSRRIYRETCGKNNLSAMELSLYYRGWNPEFVFFRFKKKTAQDLPSFHAKTEMREMPNPPKMRDYSRAEVSQIGTKFRSRAGCSLQKMLGRRFELLRPFGHRRLKPMRLPISPPERDYELQSLPIFRENASLFFRLCIFPPDADVLDFEFCGEIVG